MRPEQFELAMKYYGMPMTKEKANAIFNVIDFKNDGIIDYDEFVGVILGELEGWKPVEGTLEAPVRYKDDIDSSQSMISTTTTTTTTPAPPGAENNDKDLLTNTLEVDPALLELDEEGEGETPAIPPLNLSADANSVQILSNTSLIPDLNDIKESITKKINPIAVTQWKELQYLFRKIDARRKGYVSKLQFAGIFANFDVILDESELEYILNKYGTKTEKRSKQMLLNRPHIYTKNEPFQQQQRQQRPSSAMSLNSTMASIKKNGGVLYSKILKDMLLGGNNASLNKSLMRSMSLRNSIKSRMGQYKSKYVVSTYDPEIHNLLY